MKKSLIVYAVIFLIVTLIFVVPIIGGYFILNDFFPKADPINCPAMEDIQSVSLSGNDEHTVLLNETDYEELLHNISNSLPTRNMPMNDYPAVRQYYTITIQTSLLFDPIGSHPCAARQVLRSTISKCRIDQNIR